MVTTIISHFLRFDFCNPSLFPILMTFCYLSNSSIEPMKKPFLFTLLFLVFAITLAQAQEPIHRCHTDEHHAEKMLDPEFANEFIKLQKEIRDRIDYSRIVDCGSPIVIPVAVHFSGNVNTSNISCLVDKCYEQIEVLNEDFGGYNADIENYCEISESCPGDYPPEAVNQGSCIQFCLGEDNHPSCEPAGNLIDGLAITVGQYTWTGGPDAPCWEGYMNIFVEDNLGFLGVAPLNGANDPDGNGFVVDAAAFGGSGGGCNSGTGIDTDGTYNLGRTGTHEAGHYFGLRHTFAGCNDGDNIPDTPDQNQENFGCPSVNLGNCSSSSNDSCGEPDFWFNFMDYVDDDCMWMFTEDQAQKMNSLAGNFTSGKCSPDQSYSPEYPNGCASVTPPLELDLIDTEDVICYGEETGVIEVEASGGVPDYEYEILETGEDNDDGFFEDLPAGEYTILVTDEAGQETEIEVEIYESDEIMISTILQTMTTCFGGSDASFELVITGGNPFGGDYITSVDGSPFILDTYYENLAGGIHTVLVEDEEGCQAETEITILEPPMIVMGIDSVSLPLCFGDTLNYVDVNASGGMPDYFYTLVSTGEANGTGIFDSLPSGNIAIMVTDVMNCTQLDTVFLAEPDSMYFDNNIISNVNCFGESTGSIDLNAVGGALEYNYLLDGIGTDSMGVFNGLPAGIYYASVIDSNDCVAFDTIEIIELPESTINVTDIEGVTCGSNGDGSINFMGVGSSPSYTHSIDGITYSASGFFDNLNSGAITLYIQDVNNCIVTMDFEIPESSTIMASITNQVDAQCLGDFSGSIQASASGQGTIMFTLDGETNTTGFFDNLTTGMYTLLIEDDGDCPEEIQIEILGSSDLEIQSGSNTNSTCFNADDGIIQVNPEGGVGAYMYSINGGTFVSSNVFNNLSPDDYEIIVQDQAGCQVVGNYSIIQPDEILLTENVVNNLSCFESNDGSLDVEGVGGFGILTYTLGGESDLEGNFDDLPAGNLEVIVTDQNDCTASIFITLTQPDEITYSIINEINSNCEGDPIGGFTIQATGGAGGYTYMLGSQSNATGIFINLAADTYDIIITDQNDCTTIATAGVSSGSDINASVVSTIDPLCRTDENGEAQISANGGTGTLTFTLDGVMNTTGLFTGLDDGNYTVEITDEADCLVTVSFTLDDPDEFTVTLVDTQDATCEGGNNGQVELQAMGGTGGYLYMVDGETNSTGIFTALTASSYNAVVTDENDCIATLDFTIDGPEPINGSISNQDDVSCFGLVDGSVSFDSDLLVDIFLDGVEQSASDLSSLPAGSYDFVLMTDDGCFETIPVTIDSPSAIDIIVESQANNPCQGLDEGSIDIMATGGDGTFTYSLDGATNASGLFMNLGFGSYTIEVVDGNNCTGSHDFQISDGGQITSTIINQSADTGDSNGSIEINASGGQAPYTYLIGNGTPQVSGLFTNLEAGNYQINIVDDLGCTTTLDITIESMERPDTKAIINVLSHPNPTSDQFTLVYESFGEQIVDFSIFDTRGRYIYKKTQNAVSGFNSIVFDLSEYPQAVYLIMIEGQRISLGERIVKID